MSIPSLTHIEHHDVIAVLRYCNSPDAIIANKGAAALDEALRELLADPAVRVIVLTGERPGAFIRHADVAQILRAAEALRAGKITPDTFLDAPFPRLGATLDAADKPVIAAIDGPCMGGGLEIALACTLRIAAPSVKSIGLPEIRIGIFPGGGGTQRLRRVMGAARARCFMLDGAVVDAPAAAALGIIDELADDPLQAALKRAARWAQRSPKAVRSILRLTRQHNDDDALRAELLAFAELLRDDTAVIERLRRFVDDGEQLDQV